MTECGDRAITRRVAQTPGGANRRWSGIVGIGHREFGGHQDRLVGAARQFVGRLGETLILTFVIRNDPFEAVIGIEAALTHETRLIGLDSDAQIDDRVHVGVRSDQLEYFGNRVARFASRTVDRIPSTPARRQFLVDRRLEVVGQRHENECAVTRQRVGRDHTPTAGRGENDNVRSGRQRLRREGSRRFESLFDRCGPGDASGATEAVDGSGLARENKMTCAAMMALLDRYRIDSPLVSAMAVAGRTGTLADDFIGDPLEARLIGKTGSLTGVKALVGYVPVEGVGTIRFAVMLEGNGVEQEGTFRPIWETYLSDALSSYPSGPTADRLVPLEPVPTP